MAPHLPLLPPTSPPGGFPTTSWCPADSTVHMAPNTVLSALPQSCCSAHIHLCWKESHLRAAWDLEDDKSWPAIPPGFSPTVTIPNILCPTSHENAPIPIFLYWNIQIFIYWNIPIFQLLPDNFLHSAATQTYHKSNVPIPKSKSTVTKLSPYSKETDLIWLQRL